MKRDALSFYSCNICNTLSSQYGRLYRGLLTKDSVYLSVLLASQRQDISYRESNLACKCRPWSRRALLHPDFEYPAAVSVFMSGIKLLDDRLDEGSFRSRALYAILQKKIEEAERRLRELNLRLPSLVELVQQQHLREAVPGREITYYSRITEQIYSKVLAHTANLAGAQENVAPLAEIGLHVGRLAYILDGYLDLRSDTEKNTFNAVNHLSRQIVIECLNTSLNTIREQISKVHLVQFQEAVKHVVTDGLKTKISRVMAYPDNYHEQGTSLILPLATPLILRNLTASSGACDFGQCFRDICLRELFKNLTCSGCSNTGAANNAATTILQGIVGAVIGGLAGIAASSAASHLHPQTSRSAGESPSTSTGTQDLPTGSKSPPERPTDYGVPPPGKENVWWYKPVPQGMSAEDQMLRERLRMRDYFEQRGYEMQYTRTNSYAVERNMKCANPNCPNKIIPRKELIRVPLPGESTTIGQMFYGVVGQAAFKLSGSAAPWGIDMFSDFRKVICPSCGMKQKLVEPKRLAVAPGNIG